VRVVETLGVIDGKTKSLLIRLRALGVGPVPTLLVTAELEALTRRAARNVPWLIVEDPGHVSVYELMRARQVVFERAALVAMEEALHP
jgi:large subunit ribosomal protein L4